MIMEAFQGAAYTLAGFLIVFAIFFFYTGFKLRGGSDNRLFSTVHVVKTFFLLLGLLYLMLAHFSVYSGLAYSIELTNRAPCENVVNQSVYNVSTDSTTYTYTDSCLSRATPVGVQRLFGAFGWLLYIDIFSMSVGLLLLSFKRLWLRW